LSTPTEPVPGSLAAAMGDLQAAFRAAAETVLEALAPLSGLFVRQEQEAEAVARGEVVCGLDHTALLFPAEADDPFALAPCAGCGAAL
jgi:hypothetical protein